MERKLTAILCADVFGYSRLMGEDEEATLRTLSSHRKLIDSLIEQHHGRFVNSAGDSVLAEFASVVNAVQCAVEIQFTLKTENTNIPPERRMEFRIGVNLGDVMVDGEQIYGDGVNVAARLESLADPGSIFISGSVHEQLGNKLALGYEDLGEHAVKNIAKPVRVYRVLTELHIAAAATRKTQHVPRKYAKRGAFSVAGLAIIAATIVLVQHLSLRPPATVANTRVPFPPEVAQKVGFCKTADGVRIAYTVSGQGPPVVQVLGWFTSVAGASGNTFASEAFLKQISARHLLVRYDGRGSGLSDRGLNDYSLEPRVRDLEAVVERLRLGRFALYGDSAGGAVSVAYAARYPEQVTRLVLYGSWAGRITPSARQRETFQALITLMRNYWGSDNPAFRQIFTSLLMPDAGEADVRLFNEMERTSATSEDAAAQMSANSALDVRALAPKVRAPTLVINRRGDRAVPFEGGRELAALIPGARFMAAAGRNHVLLPGDPGAEQINDVILQFLDEDLPGK